MSLSKKPTFFLFFILTFSFVFTAQINVAKAQSQYYSSGNIQLVAHDLQCGTVFICPPELQRRIDFWIQVFRVWSLDNRIFHDARKPERIYSVLTTEDKCRRKNPKGRVKAEYKSIKSKLNALADALKKGASPESLRNRPLANLFDNLNEAELREAADSVRCQSGNRERFEKALGQFERYQPFILATLHENGLPEDIQYLPFVESAFNPRAYSHVGAAGLWQIMPKTGRSLGLQVGSAVDERLEPELATMAAAQYFVNSIEKLTSAAVLKGSPTDQHYLNPFVITSYNYGVRGMERAIEQVGTDYIRLLAEYKSNSFRTAVRNFYASFLAARYVAQKRQFYFPNVTAVVKPSTSQVKLKKAATLRQVKRAFNISKEQLRELNPSLTYRVWNGSQPIPRGYDLHLPIKSQGWSQQIKALAKMPEPKGLDSGKRHRVTRGQTACGIANRHKVSCGSLLKLNKLSRKSVIKVGQRLKVPGRGKQRYVVSDTYQRGRKLLQQKITVSSYTDDNPQKSQTNIYQQARQAAEIRSNELRENRQTQPISEQRTSTNTRSQNIAATSSVAFDTSVKQGKNNVYVRVLAGETLGHYSDWMEGGLSKIRRLNGYSSSRKISFGSRVKLPLNSAVQIQRFEQQRRAFHQKISKAFHKKYRVKRTVSKTVKAGQTLWGIASNARIPMWLLHQYNPKLRSVNKGARLRIPEVERI